MGKERSEKQIKASLENLKLAHTNNKGRKLSEETKQKIRDKRKLQVIPKHSAETRQKMSDRQKGRVVSEETRLKISETKKANPKKFSDEEKAKMSERMKGNTYSLGKKYPNKVQPKPSIETRLKMSEAHKGDKAYNWKGGVMPENHLIRKQVEVREWIKLVFKKDNYTCLKCGKKGGKLNAHHIENFSTCKEKRTDINNGATLCKDHHTEFHKIYSKKNNTRDQLIEFLGTKEITDANP